MGKLKMIICWENYGLPTVSRRNVSLHRVGDNVSVICHSFFHRALGAQSSCKWKVVISSSVQFPNNMKNENPHTIRTDRRVVPTPFIVLQVYRLHSLSQYALTNLSF